VVEFGGTGEVIGLNSLTMGTTRSPATKASAIRRARERGFKGA
jgi:urease subunit gamma/beta